MDKVEKLYRNYEILAEAKTKIKEHEAEYLEILESVKGSNNEKRLASQFIARFFKDFPHLADKAIDAQLDLCEDEDISIRKQAIKDLPSFCKGAKEYVPKIADVLAQLLQIDDSTELAIVHSSLMTVFKLDAKGTLVGLFSQIINGEDVIREKTIKFLCSKIKSLSRDALTREIEEYILQECKKVLQDVTGEEFVTVMGMLANLKVAKTISGQQALVEMITEQADLEKEFDHSDTDNVDRLMQCIRQAMPYFSQYVSSACFMNYVCLKVLPVLRELPSLNEGADIGLEILKLLAEMAPYPLKMENSQECLEIVYSRLLEYMPLPSIEESVENTSQADEPTLQLSHVECLMYAFHQLAKLHPEFLTGQENADKLKDLKLRLQYLAKGTQGYIKKLRESLHGKKSEEMKSEENKLKVMALRTTSNINSLIKDLFHNPPSYKSTINLSWKPSNTGSSNKTQAEAATGSKRKERTAITFSDGPKQAKRGFKNERELYAPPSGKYSTKVKNFQSSGSEFTGRNQGYGQSNRGRGQRFY